MRRVFVVFALFGMMAGLDALKVEATGDGHPLTLAAIGFVLLAAFALAEIGSRLGLPKVTGFVVSGLVLGPFVGGLLARPLANELEIFRSLTLGLIAVTAGLELHGRGLVTRGRLLSCTIGLQIAAVTLLVGGVAVALLVGTDLVGSMAPTQAWALALVVAALSLGSSPAMLVAIALETRAEGPITSLTLEVAVLRGFFMALCLALAVAVGAVVLGQTSLDAGGIVRASEELGFSIVAGAIGGGLIILLLRVASAHILLLLGAMVLVVAELAPVMRLGVLLVFVVLGAVVRNFSPQAPALREPLRKVSFPVFIVFFTALGAELNLLEAVGVLPLAVVVCATRALGYHVSSRMAARLTGETEAVRRFAWLGYLPQGELTLGMVMVAAAALPDLATPITHLGVAIVSIDLVIGSLTSRLAFVRAGETVDALPQDSTSTLETGDAVETTARLESPRLRRIVEESRATLEQIWATLIDKTVDQEMRRWVDRLHLPEADDKHVAARVADRLDRVPPDDAAGRLETFRSSLAMQLDRLDALPLSELVPLERRYLEISGDDSGRVRWQKRLGAAVAVVTGTTGRRVRAVPVRLLARTALEPRMVRLAEETWRDWQRFEIAALEALQRAVLSTASVPEVNRDLDALVSDCIAKIRANVDATMRAGVHQLVQSLHSAGAPGSSSQAYRYSRVERDIATALARLAEDADRWKDCREGAISTLRFIAKVENAQHQLVQDIVRDVAAPLDEAFGVVARLVEEERQRIEGLPKAASAAASDEAWERLALRAHALLPKPVLKELRAAEHRVRRATSTSAPMTGLLTFMADRDEEVRMVPSLHSLTVAVRPATVSTVAVDIRELKEVQIAGQLLPSLENALAEVAEAFTEIRETTREAAHMVELAFDAASRARAAGEELQGFDEAVERASALLASMQERACAAWSRQRGEVLSSVGRMSNRMFEAVVAAAGGDADYGRDRTSAGERWWPRIHRWMRGALARVGQWARGWLVAETGQAAEELAHLYRLRAGIERLDAQAIRALVSAQERLRSGRVPAEYSTLFAPDPLRDPRFFVANREALDVVVKAEQAWHAHPEAGNGVLVVGPSGSGKSSILGVARLKVSARRVLVLRPAKEGDASVTLALAQSLGTDATEEAVRNALLHQRSAVLLDDLQDWFLPDGQGLDAFEAFLGLMSATETNTFWILAMRAEAFEVWNHAVGLGHAFAAVPHLRPINARDLEAVLAARQRFSRYEVMYPSTFGAKIAQRVLRRSAQATFIRHLAAASHGNLRRAMQLWLAHASLGASANKGEEVLLSPVHTIGWGLPFIRQMEPAVKAALGSLVRHGPLSAATLARTIGSRTEDAHQVVRFLVASGLAERLPACGRIGIRASIRDDLIMALGDDGLVGGGVA